jgi:hypothetical protein
MTAEDAAKFEEEVRAGRIMLARGEGLIGENVSPSEYRPPIAPVVNSIPANQGVLDAYTQGRMTPEARIKEPLINSTIPSVFHGHGDPGLISANIDGFTPYFRGRNPRPGRLQTQFTCQA